ncbi:MAG: tetratricopeptide repeat protein [Gemmatimonadota bacterium]
MLKRLIHEIHRRSLWQVLAIYLGASWLVLQAVDTLAGALSLPEWAPPLALFLLIVGFPIVLATAFVQGGMGRDSAPGGAEPKPAPASQAPASPPAAERGKGAHHKIFTWRNALIGGLASLALLGLLTIGYMVTRTLGVGPAATLVARGVLEERATIILAEFDSRTGDSLLARAATEAFRIDLSQSDAIRVAAPAFIARALRRMERSPDAEVDYDLAREIAQREGIVAIVGGDINSAGGKFVLAARLTSAETGEEFAAFRETANDSSEIVPAIDKLSKRLRERIGDSYRSLRADKPLEKVTTGNLAALRKYSQALQAIHSRSDFSRGIALLEEAVVLDSSFAMAYRKLGVELSNRNESRERAVEALGMAFEYRDRLTERERYLTMATYYNQVLGDRARAITAYQNLLDMDPEDTWALNNLAGIYMSVREFERAQPLFERAIRADSSSALEYQNAQISLMGQGKFAEAETLLDAKRDRFPENPTNRFYSALLEAARWSYDKAESELRAMIEETRAFPLFMNQARFGLASVLTARGRLAEAETYRSEVSAQNEERGVPGAALGGSIGQAFVDLFLRGDTATAIDRVDSALESHPLSDISPLDRPYFQLATFYAFASDPRRARQLWQEYEAEIDPDLRGDDEVARHSVQGAIALAEGRHDEAVDEFRRSDVGGCVTCTLYPLALAYEASGQPDSALSVYEQLLSRSDPFRLFSDQGGGALTLERLGQLYDERGDWEKAAEYYARFVKLWKAADPELQPRVEAAQQRLEEIFAARG